MGEGLQEATEVRFLFPWHKATMGMVSTMKMLLGMDYEIGFIWVYHITVEFTTPQPSVSIRCISGLNLH